MVLHPLCLLPLFGLQPKKKSTNKTKTHTQYDLTLVASDSLNESVTRVVILIKDSNDLPPIFNQTVYTAHALEEMADPLPFRLLQVVSLHPKKNNNNYKKDHKQQQQLYNNYIV